MEEIVKRFINGEHQVFLSLESSLDRKNFHEEIQKQLKDRDTKSYYYLITFTLKEKPKDEEVIQKYIISQMGRPALHIVKAHYVKEYTKKGIPHWHFAVKSKRHICKNRFNYYVQKFGNIDISKNHCQTLNEMMNYINKESLSIQIIPCVL